MSPFAVEKASPPASLDGNEHSQHASTSYLRQGWSGHGVSEASDMAGLSQQPSGSEALRKAALILNAQLALIDKQVLQRVIPQAQQGPSRHHSQDLAQQVLLKLPFNERFGQTVILDFAHELYSNPLTHIDPRSRAQKRHCVLRHAMLCGCCMLLLLLCGKVAPLDMASLSVV